MARNVVLAATVLLGAISFAGTTAAQDSALAELYGRGVHAYFANDYEKAHELLTEAIEDGSKDPRCYFFRGLSYSMTGRPDEAAADFKKGSQLEATAVERVYDVSRAMQRIQGPIRLEIEEYRQKARLAARDVSARRARARYQQFQRDQDAAALPSEGRPRKSTSGSGGEGTLRGGTTAGGSVTADDPFGANTPAERPTAGATDSAPTASESTDGATEGADPFGGSDTGSDTEESPAATDDDPFSKRPNAAGAGAGANTPDPFTRKQPATTDETESDDAATEEDTEPPTAAEGAEEAEEPEEAPPAGDNAAAGAAGGKRKGALGGIFRALTPKMPEIKIPDQIGGLQIPGAGGGAAGPGGAPAVVEPEEETVDPFAKKGKAAEAAPDATEEDIPDPFNKKP